MEEGLTKKQEGILRLIYESVRDEGYPPSFEELKDNLGVASNQAILDHLVNLEKRGMITRGSRSARNIRLTRKAFLALGASPLIPYLGVSYAGGFAECPTVEGKWEVVSEEIEKLVELVYIIKVSGDSMINAGISSGDKLLVKVAKEFASGDIVVAETNGGTTVKRFISQDEPPFLYLKPENPKYKPILFTPDVHMQGKVLNKFMSGHWQPLVQGRFEW